MAAALIFFGARQLPQLSRQEGFGFGSSVLGFWFSGRLRHAATRWVQYRER